MATVSHKDLTGADLHEPKGVATAASGTVYVANGSGGGSWTTLSALTGETGKVELFATPIVPSGWLECDGSAVSRTTYANLFTALTIQQTGSRTNGSPTISALADVTSIKVGYYVGGSGITNGTTVTAVGAGTITMSANATSTGSSTVIVSPYPQGNGSTTFTIPNMTDTGRTARSRTSSVVLGTYQANQNKSHTHTSSTGGAGAHTHSGSTSTESAFHQHTFPYSLTTFSGGGVIGVNGIGSGAFSTTTSNQNVLHLHTYTTDDPGNHTHSVTVNADGGTETRPESSMFIFCIRT